MEDIEALKEKLASMEKELNKPEVFKHFPGKDDKCYFYTPMGTVDSIIAATDALRVNMFKSEEAAKKAYKKAVAIEKIKRRIVELQGDWKPDFNDDSSKYTICYNYIVNSFTNEEWQRFKHYCVLIPYMENKEIALTIIKEMEVELKLIFDIA